MNNFFYAVLMGREGVEDLSSVERFDSLDQAEAHCKECNDSFMAEYVSKDAWLANANSLEWLAYDTETMRKDHPDLEAMRDAFEAAQGA